MAGLEKFTSQLNSRGRRRLQRWAVCFGLACEKPSCNSAFPGFLRVLFCFALFSNMLGRHMLTNRRHMTVLSAFKVIFHLVD